MCIYQPEIAQSRILLIKFVLKLVYPIIWSLESFMIKLFCIFIIVPCKQPNQQQKMSMSLKIEIAM